MYFPITTHTLNTVLSDEVVVRKNGIDLSLRRSTWYLPLVILHHRTRIPFFFAPFFFPIFIGNFLEKTESNLKLISKQLEYVNTLKQTCIKCVFLSLIWKKKLINKGCYKNNKEPN